jgi:hypothetical protein
MLSFQKLEDLLKEQDFRVNKVYAFDQQCIMLELLSLRNAYTLLLYIPSKYEIAAPTAEDGVYELNYVDMDTNGMPADPEATDGEIAAPELVEELYKEVQVDTDISKEKLIERMEDKYRNPIRLLKITTDDKLHIRNIYQQLSRLRHCTKQIRYKFAIQYSNYIVFTRKDDSIDCIQIKRFFGSSSHTLFVVVDLEFIYENMDSIVADTKQVHDCVFKLLQRNQKNNISTLMKLVHQHANIFATSSVVNQKIEHYEDGVAELEKLLIGLNTSALTIENQLKELEAVNQSTSLSQQLSSSKKIAKTEEKLKKVNKLKIDTINAIQDVRLKQMNALLLFDTVLFENSVLLKSSIDNISNLNKLLQ